MANVPVSLTVVERYRLTCPIKIFNAVITDFMNVQEDGTTVSTWQINSPLILEQPVKITVIDADDAKKKAIELLKTFVNSALDLAVFSPVG